MRQHNWLIGGALAALLAAGVTFAAAASPTPSAPTALAPSASPAAVGTVSSGRLFRFGSDSQRMRYTEADYALLQSFQFKNYADMSVAEFNKRVLDWTDEDAYHKTEEAIQRLRCSLPDTDPLAPFLDTAVLHTWEQCELKHYNACQRKVYPSADGSVKWEKFADVYGDQVLIAGAYADFWYDYDIPDEAALTVQEREAFFKGIEDGMAAFLAKQSEADLSKNDAMEKAVNAELDRLIQTLNAAGIRALNGEASYCWENMS